MADLVVGSFHRQKSQRTGSAEPEAGPPEASWPRRAHAWGLRSGLPSHPALIVTLLAGDEGDTLARHCQAAIVPGPFALTAQMVRDLLDRGFPPATVVATAEAAASATSGLLGRILSYRDQLPGRNPRKAGERQAAAENLQAQRHKAVSDLSEVLHEYILAAPDPAVVHAV